MRNRKLRAAFLSTVALLVVAVAAPSTAPVIAGQNNNADKNAAVNPNKLNTKYPIKHLVVVFNENRSFDHYFGTYPNAMNPEGEPPFEPTTKNTQRDINNLLSNPSLLDNNPNLNAANGAGATNPFRLDRTQANTADQGHGYTPEQQAYDAGKNDLFPEFTGKGTNGGAGAFGTKGQVMGYFDGNTVTALWNYAQNYAMSDNAWSDQYGPSTPGAVNMFAGTANGAVVPSGFTASTIADGQGGLTLINDTDPAGDVCSSKTAQVQMTSKNIGDLLNAADIPWGSFVGGFNLQTLNNNGSTGCTRSTASQVVGGTVTDYVPHHIWFQYYASTANPTHARPTSTTAIGYTTVPGTKKVDPANHGYDLDDFFTAVGSGNYPAVSFIKMAAFQDGHPGNSDPLDEQTGLVTLVNFLQQQPDWDSTAVIVAYDDSDGWYDHGFAATTHTSFSSSDALNGAGICGTVGVTEPAGINGLPVHGRCGPGTRQPFVVISPYAKKNYVSHVLITQASIPQFIEDNWLNGQRIGGGSFDATTGSIADMFNFNKKNSISLILDPTFGIVDTKDKDKNKN
ncbi:MAG: alkaline phosphatase family protein [Bradyrhizobium sp.]|uniref:phospholipase C n=1 Tax=Bradyrhizobium sp. TaxID=376 RepID=UPI001C2852F3|nr:alkaline phosphatase family protein [Bradyrhizobium sp.]MBU6463133.1 alkaline phosphatase family protein [Pseudomonadota bacterium]MDE2068333.1 alkaline phosphatase family protein [Bradyrhizobium sp.]